VLPLVLAFLLAPQKLPPERCSIARSVIDSVSGKPLGKVQVRLQALPRGERPNFGTLTGEDGAFAMNAIEPGEYRVIAWDDVEPGSWFDAEFLNAREAEGVRETETAAYRGATVAVTASMRNLAGRFVL
jgi:hypothetical protein